MNENAIQDVLKEIKDPELGRGLVALKQVHALTLQGNELNLTLGLTTWSSPLWNTVRDEVVQRLQARFPELQTTLRVEEHARPPEKIGEIGLAAKSVIAVGSGKGGVGKSTIASTIAYGLKRAGCKVGLMDADVYGPSIPHLFGVNERPGMLNGKIQPVQVDGMPIMSIGLVVPPGEAVIWRGPMLHGAITQFLRDTDWGELDYLVIDMPPGTGDIALTLSQLLPLTGAVVVCTPQDVALLDAVKAIAMFRKVNIDVLGMVENMSFFTCTQCHARHEIFGSGGARQRAAELAVPFLGEVPLNTQMRVLGDQGRVAAGFEDEVARPYLEAICRRLVENLAAGRRQAPPMPSLSIR